MKNPKAFSMMEAALVLVLMSIIGLAAIGMYAGLLRTFTAMRESTQLTGRAQSAATYIAAEVRKSGGNGMPAWAGIFVENNHNLSSGWGSSPSWQNDSVTDRGDIPSGVDPQWMYDYFDPTFWPANIDPIPRVAASDRLTLISAIPRVAPAPVSAMTAVAPNADCVKSGSTATCTATFFVAGTTTCVFSTTSFKRYMVFLQGRNFRVFNVFSEPTLTNSTTCEYYIEDALLSMNRSTVNAVLCPPPPFPARMCGDVRGFVGGIAVLVDFRTIYIDKSTHELIMHIDTDSNGAGADPTVAGERFMIQDNVYDFQVSLGYDLNSNGVVEGGVPDDEWLYNRPTSNEYNMGLNDLSLDSGFGYAPLHFPLDWPYGTKNDDVRPFLKAVQIEMVVGIPSSGPLAGVGVVAPGRSGTPVRVPGVALRPVAVQVVPRNL